MLEGDGVGLVRFNQDAQVLESVVPLGSGSLSDINRSTTKDIINGSGLDPDGQTSIGDGIFEGRGILNAAGSFDVKSLVVLTDGMENQPRWIADVAADINEFTYAVGLGQPQNISVPALQTISGNNGGYLLVTGAIGTDNRFLLQKYFLQILAGISNAEIVLDPGGDLIPGRVERVPFQLTTGDAGVDVILLTPNTEIVDFRLETPSGQIIEPWRAQSEPGMRFVLSGDVSYYRLALPFEFIANRFDAGGTWNALLRIGRPRLERSDSRDGTDPSIRHVTAVPEVPAEVANAPARLARAQRQSVLAAEQGMAELGAIGAQGAAEPGLRTVPYSIVVHAYSNLTLEAQAEQSGFAPGGRVNLTASLAQSGIPLEGGGQVWAEVTAPAGTTMTVAMPEGTGGRFAAAFDANAVGVYRIRVRAAGTTRGGEPFAREKTLTAAVWRGGDQVTDPRTNPQVIVDYLRERDERLCKLLTCLFRRDGAITPEFERRLLDLGLDVNSVRKCLAELCRG